MKTGDKDLVAVASTTINAPAVKVWDALVNPAKIKQYMFGTDVVSDWEGRAYKDEGEILKFEPQHVIQYSHFSPLSGQPDVPENYHTVTIELSESGQQTTVTLSQDGNASEEERDHSAKNWEMMLEGLKRFLDGYVESSMVCQINAP